MSEQIYAHFATCPYCGQTITVETDSESPTESQLVEAAIESCDCFQAEKVRDTKKRLESARWTITAMFAAEEDEGLRNMIYRTVELIAYEKIASVQINAGYGRVIKIKNKRDKVQIVEIRREANGEEV